MEDKKTKSRPKKFGAEKSAPHVTIQQVNDSEEKVEEEVSWSKPEEKVSAPEATVEVQKAAPKAHPAAILPTVETTIALATCVKFVGGWRHLSKGKPITAPKEVIENLRQSGLVK